MSAGSESDVAMSYLSDSVEYFVGIQLYKDITHTDCLISKKTIMRKNEAMSLGRPNEIFYLNMKRNELLHFRANGRDQLYFKKTSDFNLLTDFG